VPLGCARSNWKFVGLPGLSCDQDGRRGHVHDQQLMARPRLDRQNVDRWNGLKLLIDDGLNPPDGGLGVGHWPKGPENLLDFFNAEYDCATECVRELGNITSAFSAALIGLIVKRGLELQKWALSRLADHKAPM